MLAERSRLVLWSGRVLILLLPGRRRKGLLSPLMLVPQKMLGWQSLHLRRRTTRELRSWRLLQVLKLRESKTQV